MLMWQVVQLYWEGMLRDLMTLRDLLTVAAEAVVVALLVHLDIEDLGKCLS